MSANPHRTFTMLAVLLGVALLLSSCGGTRVGFPYPAERIEYPGGEANLARVHLGAVVDLRPEEQRDGQGHFVGITYPADSAWERPVELLYREALTRDIAQTRLAELVPLPSQADYELEAEIFSFHARLQRNAGSFLLPLAVGMGGGLLWGEDGSDKVKRGLVLGAAGLMAIPLPAENRAECEVRLTLRDRAGEVVWTQTCIGEIDETVYRAATSRDDRGLAERFLPQAVKRCNACLLGQLRQRLSAL